MTTRPDPNPWTGRLLDRLLKGVETGGEAQGPGGVGAPEGQVEGREADPAVRREREALDRLLRLEALASDARLDAAAAARIAARVLDRVRLEEEHAERARRAATSRPALVRWAWVLGAALAAHVAVVAVWGIRALERRGGEATEPYVTLATADRPEPAPEASAPREAPLPDRALPPYVVDENLLAVERARLVDPATDVVVPTPRALTDFAPRAARAMAVRSSDALKRLIESRVGSSGSLDRVQASLRALARRQQPDGSWPSPSVTARGTTTALVLLAFLGDGSSSHGGEHRDVVARGIAALRAPGAPDGGAYGLWALAEDFLLVNGALTPSESRARSAEIAARAAAVARSEDPSVPDEARRLALDAAARVGVVARATGEPVATSVPSGSTADPRAAAWVGSAILRAGRGDEFLRWAATASVRLRAQLGDDGLVRPRPGQGEADRVLDTALLLLALETPYRTL